MSISLRQTFCDLLDAQKMPSDFGGQILVLRNKDNAYDMADRIQRGYELAKTFGGGILIPVGSNTKEEAKWTTQLLDECWSDLLIVTAYQHRYRAFLTFLQQLKQTKIRIIMAPCGIWWGNLADELYRIEKYQGTGDVAAYEEGIEWLSKTGT